jgi:hypothetical protein
VVFERLRTTHTRSTAQADEVLPQGKLQQAIV